MTKTDSHTPLNLKNSATKLSVKIGILRISESVQKKKASPSKIEKDKKASQRWSNQITAKIIFYISLKKKRILSLINIWKCQTSLWNIIMINHNIVFNVIL